LDAADVPVHPMDCRTVLRPGPPRTALALPAGIIEREADFLNGGGRLIFPLPEIEACC
jgi:hypothetical protein